MTAQERYGTLVWHAVCDITSGDVEGFEVWASATAVGENAEVSTMTARKYLERLTAMGKIEKRTFMGISGFRVFGGIDPRKGDLS
jgi:response regulator of citrate/malate metabolism